jgi:RNA polymerase sigma-70 factor (ECF subfamily)
MQQGGVLGGLSAVLDAHRHDLRRYLLAHGAGDAADDLLQELQIKVLAASAGPIQSPLNYLYRAATNLMIDHRRAQTQARARDQAWAELSDQSAHSVDPRPSADRVLEGETRLRLFKQRLEELPERARRVLLRHRVDGVSQRLIAREFGLSQSTVESDLRLAYRWLDEVRRDLDEEKPR